MSETSSERQRRLRATNPEYAERQRELSRLAKQRRRGTCERCGGATKYNGVSTNGASRVCAKCTQRRQHDERRWTREKIVRAFIRFRDETGRTPRALDAHGPCESLVLRLSGRRIRELEQVQELGLVLPAPQFVQREFGSWAEALRAAGMRPSRGGSPEHRRRAYG